jgi:hypothetical protein
VSSPSQWVDLRVGEEEKMTCAGGSGCGEGASHGGLWIRAAEEGVWAGWARQTKNEMGWMGLKMALVLFFILFLF